MVPPIALGLLCLILFVRCSPGAAREEPTETTRAVRVVPLVEMAVQPRALGYGTVEAARQWQATAEVSGRLTFVAEGLEPGEIYPAGTPVFRVDPARYENAVARAEAQVREAEAGLQEIETEKANLEGILALERESLRLAERELQRQRELLEKNGIALSAYEAVERDVIQQRNQLAQRENSLRLIPVQRSNLEASLDLAMANLEDARLDLERTTLQMPWDGRVSEVLVDEDQFVSAGTPLALFYAIDRSRVVARINTENVRHLAPPGRVFDFQSVPRMNEVLAEAGLSAMVRLPMGTDARQPITWEGEVARVQGLVETETRTVGMDVEVPDPYGHFEPSAEPPLVPGLFVEVEIAGKPQPGRLVAPVAALEAGHLWMVNAEGRLARAEVEVAFVQGDWAVLQSGPPAGTQAVVTRVHPAIEGTLLEVEVDEGYVATRDAQLLRSSEVESPGATR